ncbi:MAG TPA: sulfite exporter TauE/SafE family protein, partial [Dongiaceae bacterium]|nr:sulfite exporter TauE/SafE family protein [Dongiaceae bacterium]
MDLSSQVVLFAASLIANTLSALAGGRCRPAPAAGTAVPGAGFCQRPGNPQDRQCGFGVGASLRHFRESSLNRLFALFILACGLPGVVTGALIILKFDDHFSKLALGGLTLGIGIYSILKHDLGQQM